MKKVTQLNLNDEIFVTRRDFIDERISERKWYDLIEVKVRQLEINEDGNFLVNKSSKTPVVLMTNEDVYTKLEEARMFAQNMNEREAEDERKIRDRLKKELDNSEKVLTFLKDLRKVQSE